MQVTTIGLDIAKQVFFAVGTDRQGRQVWRKRLRREQVAAFFAQQSNDIAGLCGTEFRRSSCTRANQTAQARRGTDCCRRLNKQGFQQHIRRIRVELDIDSGYHIV